MTDKAEIQRKLGTLVLHALVFSFVMPIVVTGAIIPFILEYGIVFAIIFAPVALVVTLIYWFVARSLLLSGKAGPGFVLTGYWLAVVPLKIFLFYMALMFMLSGLDV